MQGRGCITLTNKVTKLYRELYIDDDDSDDDDNQDLMINHVPDPVLGP